MEYKIKLEPEESFGEPAIEEKGRKFKQWRKKIKNSSTKERHIQK